VVAESLAAVRITSPSSYTWFGARAGGLRADVEAAMGAASVREFLLHNLTWRLYADCYCAGRPRASIADPVANGLNGNAGFIASLSAANSGTGGREPGWTVVKPDGGSLIVERGGLRLWMAPGDVYASGPDGLQPGSGAGVLMPKELLRLSPGFYMALGDAEFAGDGSVPTVRFYWNLHRDGAAGLIATLTASLNAAGLPFRLKVVSDPAAYSRCDAGVLYTRCDDYDAVAPIVAAAHAALAAALKPATPAFTKPLAPGLALAEDPGAGSESFGTARARLLAEAIVQAAEAGAGDPATGLTTAEEVFAQAGVSLDAPFLNPGSTDRYGW
jgi:hypothetical protein